MAKTDLIDPRITEAIDRIAAKTIEFRPELSFTLIRQLVDAEVAAEREAIAKMAEAEAKRAYSNLSDNWDDFNYFAAAIRARGSKDSPSNPST